MVLMACVDIHWLNSVCVQQPHACRCFVCCAAQGHLLPQDQHQFPSRLRCHNGKLSTGSSKSLSASVGGWGCAAEMQQERVNMLCVDAVM